ncbi:MAG: hypothetical protein FWC09_08220, partial [Lachnospiraceae bacterium]|nr:hypothetical protein [Lachnospiraceae bacterium]
RFMGIGAIALGQAIGTAAGFTVSMVMLRKHFKFVFPKELYVKAIFVSGSPVGLTRLYILFTTIILNALFLRVGGGGALAVFGVVSMLHRFSTAFIVGISQTLVPLVSVFNEEQDITSIKQTMKLAFRYGNVLMLIAGVVFVVFNAQIAGIFGLPADSGFFAAMPFYAVYGILVLNTSIFSSYYNAAKKLKLANAIPFLQEFALLCGGAYILSAGFGINGIWVAFPLSGVLTLLITAFLLVAVRFRQKDLSFLLLQSRKLEKDGRYISFSVENKLEKASEAAAKISDFCEESGLPPKQTMQISMSVEEIITLIINKNKTKDFSVSVRLFILEGTIILRFRNAGEKFDAVEYYKENIADDIEKNLDIIGMKYITQSANVIYYRQTFGVNSLVVIL